MKKIKLQATGRGKVFTNYIADKGLVVRIHNKFFQFKNRKRTTQLKVCRRSQQHFAKEDGK